MYNLSKHSRRSIRLRGYDYTQQNAYFVTICVNDHRRLLDEIVNDEMHINRIGNIVNETWFAIQEQYPYVQLDEWVIMPNHVHGIIMIVEGDRRGEVTSPLPKRHTLGQIIAWFKYQSTKKINQVRKTPGQRFWQRNY